MPTIAQSAPGKVTALWGSALIRGADGKMRVLKIGDVVRPGDVILTTQNGIVEINADEPGVAQAATPASTDIDRIITGLNEGDAQTAPAAGLVGGGDGNLEEGLRVERIAEGLTASGRIAGSDAVQVTRLPEFDGTASSAPERLNPPAAGSLAAGSSAVSAAEEGAATNLGLTAPSGAQASATVRVDQVPAIGEIRKADGTLVTAGTLLTPADLSGLRYVPPADYDGSAPVGRFEYTVTSGGESATGSTTITLAAVNDAPVATPAVSIGDEDATLPVSLAGTDADGFITGVSVTSIPAGSTLLLADGVTAVLAGQVLTPAQAASLLFRPAADYNGSTGIVFTVTDNGGRVSAPATFGLNVTAVNDAPTAASDLATTPRNTAATIDVLANDRDVDGDTLSVSAATLADPSQGTVSINPDGTLRFTPANNVSGPVLISYTVTDPSGASSTASLTVNVGANTPPAGTDAVRTLAEDGAYTVAAADFGFSDADAGHSLAAVRIDTLPAAGSLLLNGVAVTAGQVVSTADIAAGRLVFTPAANASGAPYASFGFSVQDSAGGFAATPNTLRLDVTPVNDAPTPSPDSGTATEDTPLAGNLLANDSDVEADALAVTQFVVNGSTFTAGGTANIPGVGTLLIAANGDYSFTPAANYNGPVPVASYTVSDGSATSTGTLALAVSAVNDAPVAVADTATTPINTVLASIAVLSNDTDVDGDVLSVVSASLVDAAAGSVSINPDGTLRFTPALNLSGPVLINYTVRDPSGATSSATVTVNVGGNTPPTGTDASFTLAEDGARSFSAADFGFADADAGQTLANVRIDSLPGAGSLTLNGLAVAAGQVIAVASLANLVFTPAANANGNAYASFTFSVQDNAGAFDASPNTITLNVTPVADAALIGGSASGATVEDTTLSASGTLTVTDPDAGEAAFVAQTAVAGAHGTFSIDAAGAWVYTLNNADPAVQALGQGQSLPDESFTVSSIDGTSQLITVSITGTNDAALITAATGDVTEDTVLSTGGTLAISDVDAGQTGFVAQASTAGSYGSFTLNAAGVWSYALNNTLPAVQALGLGQTLSETFAVASIDGTLSSVTVTVHGTNDAAVIGGSAIGSVTEDGTLTTGGTLTVSDVDGPASFVAQPASAGSYGSFTLDAAGVWSYALNNTLPAVQALGAGQTLSETFTVTAADGTASSVLVTINGTDDAPVISTGTGSVIENTLPSATGTLSATDVDNPALAFVAGTTAGSYGSLVLAANGGWTYTLDARAEALAQGQVVSDTITVSLSDGSTTTVTLGVTGTNDAPVVSSSSITVAEQSADTPLGLSVPSDVDGDALTITVTGLPAVGTVTLADGTAVVNGQTLTAVQLAGLQFDAPADLLSATSTSFTYSVSDGTVSVSAGTTINVTPVNDAPVASSSTITVAEQSADTPLGLAAPSDVDGDALTITVTGLPAVGTVTLADGTAVSNGQVLTSSQLAGLQFDAPADLLSATSTSFTYSVSDGTVSVSAGTTISITPVNDAPVASSSTITVAEQSADTPLGLSVPSDVDGDALTITVTGLPTVGTVTLADGTAVSNGQTLTAAQLAGLQFDAPTDLLSATSTSFTYSVSDGTVSVSAGTTISVTPINDAPVASSSTITVAEQSADTPLGLSAPSDVDGDALTITVTGLPTVGSVTLADGTAVSNGQVLTAAQLAGLQFDAPADLLAATATSFTYSVSDGTVSVSAGTTISVTPVNDAPLASSSSITVAEQSADTPLGLAAPSDVDGDALTITVTGLPSIGTVTLANGTVVVNGQTLTAAQLVGLQFDAPADLLSATSTSFTYSVSDGTVSISAGTIISVTPVNDAPVASSSTITVAEQSADTPLGLSAPSDVDGDALTITVTGLPTVGSVTLAGGTAVSNGQVLTSAQLAGLQFDAPADLLAATSTSFTYSVSDGTVSISAGTTISVTPVNDAPVASNSTITVAEQSADTPLGLAAPSDVDGDALTITVTGLPTVGMVTLADGTAVVNGQTLTSAQLAGLQFDAPADLLAATATSFTYSVSDGTVSVSAGTTISVTPVNDAPLASSSSITVAEQSADTPLGLAAPSDVDGDALTITVTGLPAVGTVTLADGTAVVNGQTLTAVQLAGLQFDAPADLLSATSTSFTYSVSDGTVSVSAGTTINVTPVNDAPVASSSTITVAEQSADTPLGLAAPSDVDGDALTITVTGLPAVGTVTLADGTAVSNGQVLTSSQLAGLQFDAPADLLSATSTSFTYSVSDGTVSVSAGTTISITPVNDAPVASSSTITVAEQSADTPLGLSVPSDVDGDALTITVTGLPTVGTVTLADGTAVSNGQTLTAAQLAGLQFDAPTDLLSATSTSFTYSVSDGTVSVSAGTTISVTPINDAPVASSSTITVAEQSADTPLGLSAPSDVDGDALTITVTGLPTVGSVTLADGTAVSNGQVLTAAQLAGLQFDAPADLLAATATSFTYSVSDGTVSVSAGTTISVTPVNDAPLASSSSITVAEQSADTPLGLAAPSDVDGDALTITVTGLPSIGTVTLANGTVVVNGQTLTAAQLVGLQFDAPADLLSATSTSFTYSVSDGTVSVSAGTTISVTPVNDAPVAQPGSAGTSENLVLNANVPAATDVDGSIAGYALVAGPGAGDGALVFNADGSYRFDPGTDFDSLAAGATRTVTFTYRAIDNNGAPSTPATVTLTVTGTNDAPVAQPASVTIAEDEAVLNSAVTATDIDNAALLSFALNGAAPAGLVFNPNGSYAFDPSNAAYQSLALGQSQVLTIPYTVTDGQGASSTANLVITVTGTNDAPVAQAAAFTVAEDAPVVNGNVLATDIDAGAVPTYTLNLAAPAGLVFNPDGSYSFDASASAYQSLGQGQSAVITLPYTATDAQGASSTANLVITVTGTNDAPVAQAAAFSVVEDAPVVTGAVAATDIDSGALLSFALTAAAPAGLSFNADGSYSFNPADPAYQALRAGDSLLITVPYTVTDLQGASSSANLVITVTGTNDAPVAAADSASVAEDGSVVIDVRGNDSDAEGSPLTITQVAGLPIAVGGTVAVPEGSVTLNLDGTLGFTPNANYNGSLSFAYTVSDGSASSGAQVDVTVTPVNDAPVASGSAALAPVAEDTASPAGATVGTLFAGSFADAADAANPGQNQFAGIAVRGQFVDPAAGRWQYSTDGGGTWSNFGSLSDSAAFTLDTSARLRFSPAADYYGTPSNLTVRLIDNSAGAVVNGTIVNVGAGNNGGSTPVSADTVPLSTTITPVNDAPVAQPASFATGEDAPMLSGNVTATDADAGALLNYALNGAAPAGLVFNSDGSYSFDPSNAAYQSLGVGQSSVITVPYTVTDDQGASSSANLVITITGTNDAPVAQASSFSVLEDGALVNGSVSATDIDNNAVLGFALNGAAPAGLVFNPNGGYSFDAADPAYQSLATGQVLVLTVPYTVTDDLGLTSGANLVITITGVNDAAVVTGVATGSVTEDGTLTAAGNLAATDVDSPAGISAANVIGTYGNFAIDAAGAWTYTLRNGDANVQALGSSQQPTETFNVTTADGTVQQITVTVNGSNETPAAIVTPASGLEDAAGIPVTLSGSDADGTVASFTITTLPANGVLLFGGVPVALGSVIPASAGSAALSFVPAANWNGSTTLGFSATDDEAAASPAVSQSITVTAVNDAPVAVADTATTPINTVLASIAVLSNDTDVDGDVLSVVSASLADAAAGSVSINPDGTLRFTPALNLSGPVLINYTVRDPSGATSSATVTVNVGGNTPPTGTDASFTLAEDGSRSFSAADFGFADADAGQTLANVRIDSLPAAGSLTLNGLAVSAGQVIALASLADLVFTPAANANGNAYASFTFSVQDNAGAFDASPNTITLNVTPVADAALIGGSASGATVEDTTLSASGTLTVTDPDAGEAAFVAQTAVAGAHGTFSIDAAGAWVYTLNNADPAVQALGQGQSLPDESFTVSSIDGTSQLITVSITGTNDAALITAATGDVTEDTVLSTGGTLAISDVDAGQTGFVAQASTAGSYGSFTLNAAGVWSYALNNTLPAVQALGLGQTLSETFAVASIDGTLSSVTVTVHGTNDAAVIGGSAIGSVTEDGTLTTGGTLTVSDVDGPASFVAQPASAGSYGSFTLDAAGVWSYALNNTLPAVQALGAGQTLSETFTVTAADGTASSVLVTINGTDDAPVISTGTGSVIENTLPSATGTLSATDVDNPVLAFVAGTTAGSYGSLVLAANGGWTYTLDARAEALAQGQVVSDTITVSLSDGSTTTVTLGVTGTNDAPVVSSSSITVAEQSADTPLGLSAPSDVDGDALTITVTGLPAVGTVTLANGTAVSNGQVLTAAQLAGLQFDAPADLLSATSTSFTYSVSDGTVSVSAGTTINVTPVNDAPVASSSTITVAEQSADTPLGLAAPSDVDGDALTITVTGLPAVGTVTLADGTAVVNGQTLTAVQLAGLQFDAPADLLSATSTSFTYSVSDGTVSVSAGTTISITPVNDAPVASNSTITVAEQSADTPLGLAAPSDVDGDALTITVTGLPAVGTVTLADGTAVVNGQTLTAVQLAGLQFDAPADLLSATSTSFTYSVSDGTVSVSAGTTINVTPVNDAPVASSSTITVAEQSADTPLGLAAPSDVDGDALTITVTGLPAVGTVTLADGTAVSNGQVLTSSQLAGLQFDAPADLLSATSTSFTYSVSDGTVSVSAGTTISITPVNDAPVASSSTITVAEQSADTPLGLSVPSDVDGDALTITVTGLPTVGTVTLADGTAVSNGQTLTAAQLAGLQFDAPTDLLSATSTSFTYSVSDGTVSVSAGTTISVTPINDAPVASSSTITVAEQSADTPLGLSAPSDVDGDALTITVTGLPTVGSVTLADGTAVSNGQVLTAAQLAGLQFDAPADLLAATATSFTYSVSDGTVSVSAGTTISVTPVNDAPLASSSSITVAEQSADTPLGLAAPSDVDGDALTITVTGLPSIGTVTLANGTVVVNGQTLTAAQLVGLQFDAPADLLSATSTSFTYSVSDGTVSISAGTIISVTPVNDAPVASSSTITVAEQSADTPLGLSAPSDVDGDALTITVTGLPTVGSVTLAGGTAVSNGQVLTSAQLAGLQFDAPADLLAATSTSFTYSVSDGTVSVSAGTTISVTPVNDAPVASSSTITVAEQSADTPLGLAAPSDVDGDALTITVTGLPAVGTVTLADGTAVVNGQTLTAVQLAGLQFDAPADLLSATSTSFTYSVSDGTVSVSAGTTVSVTPVNDAPVASSSTITVAEQSADTPLGLAAPSDVDGDALTITVTGLPSIGTVTLADGTAVSNGQVLTSSQLAGLQFDAPADLLAATATSFTYSVSDGTVSVSAGTTINVTPVNDAPVASSSTITVAEQSADTPLGLAAPSDVDGDALTITITGLPTVGSVTLADGTAVSNGQVLTSAQLAGLQFDAPADLLSATSTSFTYSVSDGTVSVSAGTTINVTPVNDAPVASSSTITVAEQSADTPLGLSVPSDVDGDALTITVTGLPTVGTITLADGTAVSNGQTLTSAQLAGLQFDAPADLLAATSTSFTYTVSDGTVSISAGTTINVTPVNDAPVALADTATAVEDTTLTVTAASGVLANDSDVDSTISVSSFTWNGSTYAAGSSATLAGVGTLQLDANGAYTFTPASNYAGSVPSVSYAVSDGVTSTTSTLSLSITAVADAPSLTLNGTTTTGGTTTTTLPVATGLTLAFYDNIAGVSTSNAGTISNVESGVESATPTSTSIATDVAIASIGTDDAYRYTGYIYLQAGQSYTVAGSRDDTLAVKIGGSSVYGVGYNNWGSFTASTFTPTTSGYYSIEVIAYNGDGPGALDLGLSVNGAAALDLSTANFQLYANASTLTGSGTVVGGFVPNNDGGHYATTIRGNEDGAIPLGNISAALVDTDGSETLALAVSALPVGSTLSDGTNTFTATAGSTSVTVTGWNLNALTFTPPANVSGAIALSVTATATESTGVAASSTGTLNVTVTPVADAPALVVSNVLLALAQGSGAASTISFPIISTLVDTDGSESLAITVSGLPTTATFNNGSNLGSGTWSFTAADLDDLTLTLPAGYTTTGTTLTVTSTATESANGAAAGTSTTLTLISDYTETSYTGSGSANTRSGGGTDDYINGAGGNDTLSGNNGNDIIYGGTGADNISGGSGTDILFGEAGNDIIVGGADSDRISGGAGSDTLTGGTGSGTDTTVDVFTWTLADAGSVGTPAIDTITDFNAAAASSGGDVLDLRDLLAADVVGAGNTAGNLANYLDFDTTSSAGNTIIRISSSGGFAGGVYSAGAEDQRIVLQGVDVRSAGAFGLNASSTDNDIIQQLLQRGKLITDSP